MTQDFKQWLREPQQDGNDRVGDIARDILEDTDWPEGYNLRQCIDHIEARGASVHAVSALRELWSRWMVAGAQA